MKVYVEIEREGLIWALVRYGYSYGDIADIFGLPRSTVYSMAQKCPTNWRPSWVKRGVIGAELYEATYQSWSRLKQRCNNKNASGYKHYGGRGITYDPRWEKFENFLLDMGIKPDKKLSIDRIDPNGNYEPDNCRWTDSKTQSLNTRGRRNK